MHSCFQQFLEWWNNFDCEVIWTEKTYTNKKLLVGGCPDLLVKKDNKYILIDFKTSSREKAEDWITNYFIQGSAYAEMYQEHFEEEINQIVILIVTEEGTTQVFKKNKNDYLPKLKDVIEQFYKWVENERNT